MSTGAKAKVKKSTSSRKANYVIVCPDDSSVSANTYSSLDSARKDARSWARDYADNGMYASGVYIAQVVERVISKSNPKDFLDVPVVEV